MSILSQDLTPLFDLARIMACLDRSYPRMISQIDRDPHSPTFGSCDRNYWMYRLRDFESGVLMQSSLTLAALDALAGLVDMTGCRHLKPENRPYWRALALAINRRTVDLLARNKGHLDEYYPGERSLPATAFSAYAVLKSACMLDQDEILDSEGLKAAAERLIRRQPAPCANQDAGAAAFLALYSKTRRWQRNRAAEAIKRLLAGQNGKGGFWEYGGRDLGYATVALNYLACMLADASYAAGEDLDRLAQEVADFVTPGGGLGGEFASRSTTYWLPLGLVAASRRDPLLAARLGRLELGDVFDKLDDRYLMHYFLPSVALACLDLAQQGLPLIGKEPPPVMTFHQQAGIFVYQSGEAAVFVSMNKGGAVQVESKESTVIDCGYRLRRAGRVFATCISDLTLETDLDQGDQGAALEVKARFGRFPALTPSPLKTIALRLLWFLGPWLSSYFKKRLIQRPKTLEGAALRRRVRLDLSRDAVTVEDHITGLRPGDELYTAPPVSFRLVPSARFYQKGEEDGFMAQESLEEGTEVFHKREISLKTGDG
jgi:hypothetical protein